MESLFDLKMLTESGIQKMADIGFLPFLFLMICSLATSFLVSHLYLRFYGSKGTGSTLHRSFPLLGVAITAIFVCLQFSIPLSLGLLGALSIVRFRTPIKDPEEVGFILLIIATSITCATFNMPFLVLILGVSILGLWILKKDTKYFRKTSHEGMLVSKVPLVLYNEKNQKLLETIKKNLKNPKIDSIVENDDTCVISYVFGGLTEANVASLKASLAEIDPNIKTNIFFNQNEM